MARFNKLEYEQPEEHRLPKVHATQRGMDARSWAQRADTSRRMGMYEGALQFYSRALEEEKTLVACWVGQVQMLIQLQEYPEAELWSRKALELYPSDGELFAARAQALCRQKRQQEGQGAIDRAMQQPGESAYRWIVRGELLLAARQSQHRHCFDKALQCDPDWLTPVEIGLVYRHYGQPSNALSRARLGIERNSSAPYAWYVVAQCQLDLGMSKPARQSVQNCLDLMPEYREAQDLLAATESSSGLWKRWRRLWRN